MTEERVACALVEQLRLGGVARDFRMMAAQGLLPLRPEDLVELWTGLIHDADKGVRAAAARSLMSLPTAEIVPILKSGETPARVLSSLFVHRPEQELRDAVLQNTALTAATIEAVTAVPLPALAELVAVNRRRLMRRTSLVVLRELREAFRAEDAAADSPPAPPEPEPESESGIASLGDVFMTEDEAMVRYLSEEERQQTEKVSAVQKIYRLNTAERLITALKGSREERAILIRDPNRLVWAAVLSSPRVAGPEIDAFSAMANIAGEVLRYIGGHPEWARRHGVTSNLTRNARTPEVVRKRLREVSRGAGSKGEASADPERGELVRRAGVLIASTRHSVLALKGRLSSDERHCILNAIEAAAKTLKARCQADPEDLCDLEGFFALAPGEQDLLLRLSSLAVTTRESLRDSGARFAVEVRERILAVLERAEVALNRGGLDELRACVDELQGAGRLLDRVRQPGGTGG